VRGLARPVGVDVSARQLATACRLPVVGWCSWPSPRWRACACRSRGPATDRLVRDLFRLHRVVRRGRSGAEYWLFALPHGGMDSAHGQVRAWW